MERFAKHGGAAIRIEKLRGMSRAVIFTSYQGTVDYDEAMPSIHEAGWALWCAFRLLHPTRLYEFERELRALFDSFKAGGTRKWITYNEEKRYLLQRYLMMPYDPRKRAKRK